MKDDDNHQIIPKKDNSLLFSTSLVFEENIDKLWFFLRDLNNEIKLIDYLENLQYIKGDNSWNKGNIVSINWIGFANIKFKCKSIFDNKNKKIIKWKAKGDIGIEYYKKVSLYRITQNDTTVVKSTVWQAEKEKEVNDYNTTRNYYLNLEYNILLKKSNYLKNLKKDINLYESCIIKSNYKKVLNFILDFNNLSQIWNNIGKNFESNNFKIEEDSFLKFEINDLPTTIFYKIIEIKIYKKKKCSKIKLEAIGTNIGYIPKLVEYKIIKIDDNRTQISILNKVKYDITKDLLTRIQNIIKEALKKYKLNIEGKNENNHQININNNYVQNENMPNDNI